MAIFVYKVLDVKSGALPNIWRFGWVKDTKYGMNFFNEKLPNAAIFQVYRYYHFWVIKAKPAGGGGLKIPPQINWLFSGFIMYVTLNIESSLDWMS